MYDARLRLLQMGRQLYTTILELEEQFTTEAIENRQLLEEVRTRISELLAPQLEEWHSKLPGRRKESPKGTQQGGDRINYVNEDSGLALENMVEQPTNPEDTADDVDANSFKQPKSNQRSTERDEALGADVECTADCEKELTEVSSTREHDIEKRKGEDNARQIAERLQKVVQFLLNENTKAAACIGYLNRENAAYAPLEAALEKHPLALWKKAALEEKKRATQLTKPDIQNSKETDVRSLHQVRKPLLSEAKTHRAAKGAALRRNSLSQTRPEKQKKESPNDDLIIEVRC